jgi:hypothetical protein
MPYARYVKKSFFSIRFEVGHFLQPQQRKNSFFNESLVKKYFLTVFLSDLKVVCSLCFFDDLAKGKWNVFNTPQIKSMHRNNVPLD